MKCVLILDLFHRSLRLHTLFFFYILIVPVLCLQVFCFVLFSSVLNLSCSNFILYVVFLSSRISILFFFKDFISLLRSSVLSICLWFSFNLWIILIIVVLKCYLPTSSSQLFLFLVILADFFLWLYIGSLVCGVRVIILGRPSGSLWNFLPPPAKKVYQNKYHFLGWEVVCGQTAEISAIPRYLYKGGVLLPELTARVPLNYKLWLLP